MRNFILLSSLLLVCSFTFSQSTKAYHSMLKSMYKNTVPLYYSEELIAKINANKNVILLDAREDEEFNISHIKNAKLVGYDNFSMEALKDISKNDTIIAYCSVGYRSERIAEKLLKEGYKNV